MHFDLSIFGWEPESEVTVFLLLEIGLKTREKEDAPVVNADWFVISFRSLRLLRQILNQFENINAQITHLTAAS